jgi:hypothetical protein
MNTQVSKFENDLAYRVTTVFAPSDVGIYAIFPQDDKYFNSYWDTCREQFAKKFLKDSFGFFISVLEDHRENIPKFISDCEMLLNLRIKSKFYLTDMKNVIFIKPSKFWRRCYMRRSLFSLLCRLGIFYHLGPKFEEFLLGDVDDTKRDKIDSSYNFARRTRDSIMRFFSGYTRYVGEGPNFCEYFPEKHGWVEEFNGKSRAYVKAVLKPSNKKNRNTFWFDPSIFLS